MAQRRREHTRGVSFQPAQKPQRRLPACRDAAAQSSRFALFSFGQSPTCDTLVTRRPSSTVDVGEDSGPRLRRSRDSPIIDLAPVFVGWSSVDCLESPDRSDGGELRRFGLLVDSPVELLERQGFQRAEVAALGAVDE